MWCACPVVNPNLLLSLLLVLLLLQEAHDHTQSITHQWQRYEMGWYMG
jgi:hypothetical protein